MYIIYGNANELYDLKKFIGICTQRTINVLVELTHKKQNRKKPRPQKCTCQMASKSVERFN